MKQARPLEGIRVVDYSHFLAGPYVGRCLAALGAEVIKVERPGGGDAGRQHATVLDDRSSGYFLQLNMGKRGVSVNMKDPRGKAFMERLCDSADVFVENYRPGALDKLGRLRSAFRAQSRAGLLLHFRVWPHGAGRPSRGFRTDRRGQERHHADGRHAGRPSTAAAYFARGHVHGHSCGRGHQCGAARPREKRARAAHRHGALRHARLDARICGPVLHACRCASRTDRARHARLDALWCVSRDRWRSRDRRAGGRCVEALRVADRSERRAARLWHRRAVSP